MSRKKILLCAGILAAIAAITGGSILWRTGSALSEIQARVADGANLRMSVRPVAFTIPAGLEPVGAPEVFVDAQVFERRLFIAGPAGVTAFDANGTVAARHRAGIELPSAPATALAVGIAGDSRMPELWIGTAGEGLVAFDGRSFRHIRPESAQFGKITALLPTSTGRILLGTEKAGVLVWDGTRLGQFHASLASAPVTALAGDDADLWVGTLDRGLLHWNAGALASLNDTLPDRRILALAKSGETVYAGTALGVAEVRNGNVTRVLAQGYFAQALLASEGKLWLGTLEEGMFEVPLDAHPGRGPGPGDVKRNRICTDCSIRKIFSIDGDLYALSTSSLWRGDQPVLPATGASLKDRNIAALSLDTTGRLWIGYFDRGLQILTPAGGRGLELEDDTLFCINRIVNDSARGLTAIATANGLVLMDASAAKKRVISQSDGLIANQVTDVALRPDGAIIAATPAGISFIDASGISSVYAFQGLVNNHVYTLATDSARTLAGTLGGLSILDSGFVKASYTTANSDLKHNWITAIVAAPSANAAAPREWFIGTYGAGVVKLDGLGRWETFEDLRGNLEINANAMASSARAVYAGTLERGLAIYNTASGRWNFLTAGLPSHNVTAIETRGEMVYIGTDNGLVKVPEASLLQ